MRILHRKFGGGEVTGTTISLATNTTDFPDGTISTDLVLADAGAHSKGVNNDHSKKYTKAQPEFLFVDAKEFAVSGGTLSSPEVQNAASGLISAGTELWFKNSGSNTLVKAEVGGVSENASTTQTVISRTLGAAIGNMTYTGNDKAFDGVFPAAWYSGGNSACTVGAVSNAFVGKDWGAGNSKKLTGVVYKGSSDQGILYGSDPTINFELRGSDSASTNGSEGVLLASWSVTDANSVVSSKLTGVTSTTPYRYHWVYVSHSGTAQNMICTELEFYEDAISSVTYTLSSLSPALTGAIGDWTACYLLRSDKTKPLMYLATGQTDEPLCKETALTLTGSTSTTQVQTQQSSSLLPYFAAGNLSKQIVITVGGTDYTVSPSGTVTESSSSFSALGGTLGSHDSDGTLSNGDLTWSCSSAVYANARSSNGKSSGLWEAEFTVDSVGVYVALGIVPSTFDVSASAYPGIGAGTGISYWSDGSRYKDGSNIGTVATFTTGDKIGVVIDMTNGKGWFKKNGVYVNGGDPFSGTNPDITGLSGTQHVDVMTRGATASQVTCNFSGPFTYPTSSYTTTIPIPTQASAPTAAKIADRFTTEVEINSAAYSASGVTLLGALTTLVANVRRLALKLRGDFGKAKTINIYTKEQ